MEEEAAGRGRYGRCRAMARMGVERRSFQQRSPAVTGGVRPRMCGPAAIRPGGDPAAAPGAVGPAGTAAASL